MMINYRLVGDGHVCEVQICHNSLLVARKGLPGHLIYGRVRNATELLEQLDLALDEWTHRLNTDLCRGLMRCASGRGAGAWRRCGGCGPSRSRCRNC